MGAGPAECSRTRVRAGSGGAGEHEQDDGHGQATGGHHRRDPADDPEQDRAATATVGAARHTAARTARAPRTRSRRRPHPTQDLRRVADGQRVDPVHDRQHERDRQEHDARRQAEALGLPGWPGWARGETMLWRPVRGSRLDIGAKRSRARRLSRPGRAADRAVVDRDVVRQPWPGQRLAEAPSGLAERLAEKRPRVVDRVERPPAVDNADLEAVGEERAVAPAPELYSGAPPARVEPRRRARSRARSAGVRRLARSGRPRPSPRGRSRGTPTRRRRGVGPRFRRARQARRHPGDRTNASAERGQSVGELPVWLPTHATSRSASGPSASSARGILPSTSSAAARRRARGSGSVTGRSDTNGEYRSRCSWALVDVAPLLDGVRRHRRSHPRRRRP